MSSTNRGATDPSMIKKYAMLIAAKEHPYLNHDELVSASDDQKYIDQAIYVLTLGDFRQRLYAEYKEKVPYDECAVESKYLLDAMPQELRANLNEWLDNKPLSDIKVHGVSINAVMQMFGPSLKRDFLQVLKCMTIWKKYNYVDPNFCWNYFATM